MIPYPAVRFCPGISFYHETVNYPSIGTKDAWWGSARTGYRRKDLLKSQENASRTVARARSEGSYATCCHVLAPNWCLSCIYHQTASALLRPNLSGVILCRALHYIVCTSSLLGEFPTWREIILAQDTFRRLRQDWKSEEVTECLMLRAWMNAFFAKFTLGDICH